MFVGRSVAQDDSRNYIGASFGGSDFHVKDDHASPLIFSSVGIAPILQYNHVGENDRHIVELSYYTDYLATAADNFHDDNRRARIRYGYLRSVTEFKFLNSDLNLFLGGSLNSFLCHSDYYYLSIPPTLGRSIESWYWTNSLDLSVQCEYKPAEREFFSLQLFMPIVSNVSRPAFSPSGGYNYVQNDWKFKEFGATEVFPNNNSFNALLAYQRPVIPGVNLQVSYEWYYVSYDVPKEIRMYMNNLRAGFFYCF
jgi:hypothetical protein